MKAMSKNDQYPLGVGIVVMETTSIIADLCQKISEKGKENNEDPLMNETQVQRSNNYVQKYTCTQFLGHSEQMHYIC